MFVDTVHMSLILVAPTRPPRDVTPSTTSRSVSVSWSTIECIERNGEITNYTVVFQEQGGAVIPGEVNVMDRTFTASGLIPHTKLHLQSSWSQQQWCRTLYKYYRYSY